MERQCWPGVVAMAANRWRSLPERLEPCCNRGAYEIRAQDNRRSESKRLRGACVGAIRVAEVSSPAKGLYPAQSRREILVQQRLRLNSATPQSLRQRHSGDSDVDRLRRACGFEAVALIGAEEEQLILDDWSANGSTKLIEAQRRLESAAGYGIDSGWFRKYSFASRASLRKYSQRLPW